MSASTGPLPLFMLLLLLLLHDAGAAAGAEEELFHFFDEFSHSCVRNCSAQPQARTCRYRLRLEWYTAMPKACYACPHSLADCQRPHCATGDGVRRAFLAINRQLNGPGLHVCEGDTVVVEVHNHMEMGEAVTLHWHGLHMRGTQHMDGVAMVTQCPINAHSSFVYTFEAAPSGTHLYHSHSGLQRTEGLFGPLVVRSSRDPHASLYDFDLPQHTLLLADWFHVDGATKFSLHHYSDGDNKPKGLLISGRGAYVNFASGNSSSSNSSNSSSCSTAGLYTPRYTLHVQRSRRYRIRVISAASLNCPFLLAVANHSLLVLASDGQPLRPISVQSLVIYAGERFDFVLTADQPVANYLLHVVGMADCDSHFTSARQTAIVSYQGADVSELQGRGNPDYDEMLAAASGGKRLNPFNREGDQNNVPIADTEALPPDGNNPMAGQQENLERVDKKFYLAFDFEKVNNSRYHHPAYYPISAIRKSDGHLYTPQINGIAMSMPHSPVLYQLADLDQKLLCSNPDFDPKYEENFVECHHTLRLALNDVAEFVLIDKGFTFEASHPFHLHGNYFRVVGMEKLNSSVTVAEVKALDAAGRLRRNLTSAPLKDTVIVPDGGYTIVRFRADNPGAWLLHCHLEWHVEVGMGLLLLVGDPATWAANIPGDFPRCGDWPPRVAATGHRGQGDGGLLLLWLLVVSAVAAGLLLLLLSLAACHLRRRHRQSLAISG